MSRRTLPFAPTRDTLGPLTRTVTDLAIVLDTIAGYDPEDPITAWSYGQQPQTYTRFLVADALAGMRFGVIRVPMSRDTDTKAADYQETQAAISRAVADRHRQAPRGIRQEPRPHGRRARCCQASQCPR